MGKLIPVVCKFMALTYLYNLFRFVFSVSEAFFCLNVFVFVFSWCTYFILCRLEGKVN